MSATLTEKPKIEIDPEARAHAEANEGGGVFDHLLAFVPRLFPTFRGLRVTLEADPEIRDYYFVMWYVALPEEDYLAGLDKDREWPWAIREVCPPTCDVNFILSVENAG